MKEELKDKGYNNKDVAEILGVSPQITSLYLNNRRPMPLHIKKQLKELLR